MVFYATTVARVAQWLGEDKLGAEASEFLNLIVPSVSRHVETLLRQKIERTERTAYPRLKRTGFTRLLDPGWGSLSSTASLELKHAGSDRDWANTDPIDADTYSVDYEAGFVELHSPIGGGTPGTLRIVGTGGLADKFTWESGDAAGLVYMATDLDAGAGSVAGSWDGIVQAATIIAGETYRRRKTMERTQTKGRSGTAGYASAFEIPKHAMELLEPHRRRRLGR